MKSIFTLLFVATAGCGIGLLTLACGQNSPEGSPAGMRVMSSRAGGGSEDQFEELCGQALGLPDPAARHARLLELHLKKPEKPDLCIHIAQAALELGLTEAAAPWLGAARRAYGSAKEPASGEGGASEVREAGETSAASEVPEVVSKMWYLSVLSAWERQEYRDCIEWAARLERGGLPQEATAESPRLAQARLIAARARLASGIDALSGCRTIAELAESYPDMLTDQDLLRAAEFCLYSGGSSIDGGEAGESGQALRECAAGIMRHYCSGRAYAAGYADLAAELCRDCGLHDEYWIGRLEMRALSDFPAGGAEAEGWTESGSAAAEGSETVQRVRVLWQFCRNGAWSEAFEAAEELRRQDAGRQHRFIEYLHALSRINCQPHSRSAREEYTGLAKYYGREQTYFVQLYRALSGIVNTTDSTGDGVSAGAARQLYEQALQGCIAAGPYTEAARTARSALAALAGIPQQYSAEPLLPEEMQRIAGIVQEGGSPELLQPLVEALEWPENRFTLQSGLLLRQLRALPPVRHYLTGIFETTGPRSRERLQAILQL